MYNSADFAVERASLNKAPVVKAWCALRPESSVPVHIEVLKVELEKTAVYRLFCAGTEYSTVIAKRRLHHHALTERTVYEEILANLSLPVPRYFGYILEQENEFGWFFLEDVGNEKYRPHVQEHRMAAAQWLGAMHTSASPTAARVRLPERGSEHYLFLLQSAYDTIQSNVANHVLNVQELSIVESVSSHCEHLIRNWSQFANVDQGIPRTLVHGDFIENNVRIQTDKDRIIVLPFDWEKAGWGTPAEDISNVDINAYWSTVREHWSSLSLQKLARLANVGKVYRCIVYLDWIAPRLANKSIKQPMNDLKKCEVWLTHLIRAAKWRE